MQQQRALHRGTPAWGDGGRARPCHLGGMAGQQLGPAQIIIWEEHTSECKAAL